MKKTLITITSITAIIGIALTTAFVTTNYYSKDIRPIGDSSVSPPKTSANIIGVNENIVRLLEENRNLRNNFNRLLEENENLRKQLESTKLNNN